MKILIGIPIHVSKDYAMERWLENVAKLEYPADLMMVDNSPDLDYVEKVKSYCKKYGLKAKILHLEVTQEPETSENRNELIHERIIRSEEMIRTEFLKRDYDAWFFWENDILIPTNALGKLVDLMESGGFEVLIHNCWVNDIPNQVNFHFGITLFGQEFLEKHSFLPVFGPGPDTAPSWFEAENWFRARLRKENSNFIEVQGIIEPVYHLAK